MKIELDNVGTLEWFNNDERLHRENGPAVICADGSMWWYVGGKIHRDGDKPAIVHSDGYKKWRRNEKLHRDDGKPAIVETKTDDIILWFANGAKVE